MFKKRLKGDLAVLKLSHINKYYHVGETVTKAQNDVSVDFRQQEFVASWDLVDLEKLPC